MLIEKIYNHFSLPIEFDESKQKLFNNLYEDLELLKSNSDTISPVYQQLFSPETNIGKKCLHKWGEYYTTNARFLKDSQKLYKNINTFEQTPKDKAIIKKCWTYWDNIKQSDNFSEKFQYIEWDSLKFLNKSEIFMGIITFYQIASPILSLIAPIILLIIPFIILKIMKIPITIAKYTEILMQQLDKHSLGQLFTRFKDSSWNQRSYLIMCGGMYLYQIYQNFISCYKFYINTKLITSTFESFKTYLQYTKQTINTYIAHIDKLPAYKNYKIYLADKLKDINKLYTVINNIPTATFNPSKMVSMGKIMKEFYILQTCPHVEKIILFTFGFNGYVETLGGLHKNIQTNAINPIKISSKKKCRVRIKNLYHPSIHNTNKIITNNIDVKHNKIITGPNAAGKTTLLKATIINVLLSQQLGLGFYKSGVIVPFHFIHCYLNIPDTNSRDSLFQAEARRCYNILNMIKANKTKRHFCIFDELYSGTNPYEAIGTAHAYLNFIAKYPNVKFMLTTHYIRLCNLFKNHPTIHNYNMETNITKGNPTYTYKIINGISQIKGGVMILKQLNYPETIINNATKIIHKL